MLTPMLTTWTTGSSQTSYSSGQTLAQWIDNHVARASYSMGTNPPSSSGPIVTTWTSGGQGYSVPTEALPGESVSDWIARHWAAVREEMEIHPPDTQ